MSSAFEIRQGEVRDLEALRALYRRSSLSNEADRELLLTNPSLLELPAEALSEGRARVALSGGEVVGFVSLCRAPGRLGVDDLFVDPGFMGQGVGRLLMLEVAAAARRQALSCVEVVANLGAAGFYEKLGFVSLGEVTTPLGARALRMRLDLGRDRAEHAAVLVFDGDCGFCTTAARWAERGFRRGERAEAWQLLGEEVIESFGLSLDEVAQAAWWIEGEGTPERGHRAVGRALQAGGGWRRPAAWLVLTPPASWLAAGLYRLVRWRHRLPGGSPACRSEGRVLRRAPRSTRSRPARSGSGSR